MVFISKLVFIHVKIKVLVHSIDVEVGLVRSITFDTTIVHWNIIVEVETSRVKQVLVLSTTFDTTIVHWNIIVENESARLFLLMFIAFLFGAVASFACGALKFEVLLHAFSIMLTPLVFV